MAMSEEDKKELAELFSDAVAAGHAKYQAIVDEAEAKAKAGGNTQSPPKETKEDEGGFLQRYILGGKA